MKKALSIVLALLMVLALAGCAGGGSTSTAGTSSSGGAEVENDVPTGGQIIYGTTTELNGDLGNAWWTNGAADATLRALIDDYAPITTDQGGNFVINQSVTDGDIGITENDDGSVTYTVKIKDGLVYNNGDPITAADYCASYMLAYAPATVADGATTLADASSYIGGPEYASGESETFSGLHLIDDLTWSITVAPDYVYYFGRQYVSVTPKSLKMYSSADLSIKDDGDGCYIDGGELKSDEIDASRWIYEDRISAGPYTLVDFDESALTATVKINENYAGNFEGQKPHVETVVIVKAVTETEFDAIKTGEIDFLGTLSDGTEINNALDLEETGDFVTTHYDRNGYGYLGFVCDFGPTQFVNVRQAIAHLLDRPAFAQTFTGGYGSVVNGPYGSAMWMAQESEEELAQLDTYAYSVDDAIALLEEDGWTLDENGDPYESGLRYKEVTAEEAGDYTHTKTLPDGRILMALEMEWASSEQNPVSELLVTMLASGDQVAQAGMKINQTVMSFTDLLNYLGRDSSQGEQYGVPTYNMFNLASNWGAVYDPSYEFTSDPELLALGYNSNRLFDDELDQLSMDMVYGVEEGDTEGYRQKFVEYVTRWNELLPALPLYSNVYYDLYASRIKNLDCNSLFSFDQAVVYAYIE